MESIELRLTIPLVILLDTLFTLMLSQIKAILLIYSDEHFKKC